MEPRKSRGRRAVDSRTVRGVTVAVATVALGATAVVTFVSGGGRNTASAGSIPADSVRIEEVAPNVVEVAAGPNGSTGVFTVDCGTNENGKFSSDNPVAQPGISNGAEHLHDFVGNLAINANTSDEALAASGTTCRNGDRSSYFWPVVRIDRSPRSGVGDVGTPTVSCPPARGRMPSIPPAAYGSVQRALGELDRQIAEANARLAGSQGVDARRNNEVLSWLRARRAATLRQVAGELGRFGARPTGLMSLVDCAVSYDALHAGHSTDGRTQANPMVECPTVRDRLPAVPAQAAAEVDQNLNLLDRQIAEANERLLTTAGEGGPNFAQNAIVGPLRDKRRATLDRIEIAIGRHAARPTGLTQLASCTLLGPGSGDNGDGGDNGGAGDGADGPDAEPSALPVPSGPDLELPGNTGGIVRPAEVLIEYRGNPVSKVTPMPRFLRALTGESKPTSRGPGNARNSWTCSGFTDRLSDKYPICPKGSQVLRVHDFPGCWDGVNIDSDNHRSHLSFADATTGACPTGFVAIPQLRITIAYYIPRDVQFKGQYLLDSFPEEDHNPFSDHNDFINVNSEKQMRKIAKCINAGRSCR